MADILLIEPSQPLAKNYTIVLEAAGHQVRHCATGQSAIEAADKRSPDLLIVELQLAKHNGLELLYEFRSYAEWQQIPVIVLSVIPKYLVDKSIALPLLGVSQYLYKPKTKLRQLTAEVDEVLARRSGF